ncbi:MAG: NAD(P)-dependent oxidoreductase [Burkholderiaceae bacterium]|nr:NAD(P)-dependent oxidoreductase [Burkholderiaceae bacterium]
MALNLHQAGHKLCVWNRDRTKLTPLLDKGIAPADSPAAVARDAELVVSMVADDIASREVMLGALGVVGAAAPGAIVIDSSTNSPALAREIAAAAARRGVAYLDAPVLGSIAQAQNRELVFVVGGEQAAFDQAQPVLAAMGRLTRRVGPSGAGATLKLVNNMLTGSVTAALVEAAQVAEAAGLDRAAVSEILGEGAAGSRLVKTKLPKIFQRDFTPQFQLELMEKDLRYFVALAQEVDRAVPLAALVRSQFHAARRAQLGKLDSCALFLQATGEKAPG